VPPVPERKTKRDTGIVEAPWEKKESGPVEPGAAGKEKRVTIPPTPRGGQSAPPPPMQAAEFDEQGNYAQVAPEPVAPPKRVSPLPPRVQTPEALEDDGLDPT